MSGEKRADILRSFEFSCRPARNVYLGKRADPGSLGLHSNLSDPDAPARALGIEMAAFR
jgi:hypothetical protein